MRLPYSFTASLDPFSWASLPSSTSVMLPSAAFFTKALSETCISVSMEAVGRSPGNVEGVVAPPEPGVFVGGLLDWPGGPPGFCARADPHRIIAVSKQCVCNRMDITYSAFDCDGSK